MKANKLISELSIQKIWNKINKHNKEINAYKNNIAIDEENGIVDLNLQTRFLGGILQPVLADGTDLNTVMTPNTYTLKNNTNAKYSNCPVTSGTGTLTVESSGEEGQVHQVFTSCSKTNPMTYERFYYADSWGEWVCTSGDYVIECGATSMWIYKKWASGYCECFGATSFNATATGNNVVEITLPFTFNSSTFYVFALPSRNGSVVTKYGDYNVAGNIEHTTTSFKFYYTVSGEYGVGFNFEVKGRWR